MTPIHRFLVVLWLASLVLSARAQWPPEDFDPAQASVEIQARLAAGDLDSALTVAEDLATFEQIAYLEALREVVRIHCLRGEHGAAMESLTQLLDHGYWDYRGLRQDPDLALVTEDERFGPMVRKAWSAQYIRMLERDSREEMQKPAEIMARLELQPGLRVADIGAGSGYFTIPVAKAVAPGGKVWATDIRQEMLDHIAHRLEAEAVANVELVKVAPDDPGLPAGQIDLILMVDVFHYIKERQAFGEKLRRALAPGGRLAVIDFRYDPAAEREFAPPVEQQIARVDLDRDLAAAGFTVAAAHDFLPEQYFVIYTATEDR